MATFDSVLKRALGVNRIVLEDTELETAPNGVHSLHLYVRPYQRDSNRCPHCNRVCQRYDRGNNRARRRWRSLDWGGLFVYLHAETHRVICSEHGVVTAAVPWAFEHSCFTKQFDYTVAWFARYIPHSALANYLRVDWKTIGRSMRRVLNKLEPDPKVRLNGLVNIGVDETSYCKGHSYITVVVNHDTNTVVWMAEGHGKKVFSKFFESLTPEQRSGIRTVSGDGARWIDECMAEYVPHAVRCTDRFHVVQWGNEMLDDIRRLIWREHRHEARKEIQKAQTCADDKKAKEHKTLKKDKMAVAGMLKGSRYALGKAPENLTVRQEETLAVIAATEPKLYRAYSCKEALRAILKMTHVDDAKRELQRWYYRATHSKIPRVIELARKVRRHFDGILNSIATGFTNARIEATNAKIKLNIRRARGYRNLDNLTAMIMLDCSNLHIPLPNRP